MHPSQAILIIRGNPLISRNAKGFFFFKNLIFSIVTSPPPPLAYSCGWQGIENDHNTAHYTIGLGIVFITSSVYIEAESSTDKVGSRKLDQKCKETTMSPQGSDRLFIISCLLNLSSWQNYFTCREPFVKVIFFSLPVKKYWPKSE